MRTCSTRPGFPSSGSSPSSKTNCTQSLSSRHCYLLRYRLAYDSGCLASSFSSQARRKPRRHVSRLFPEMSASRCLDLRASSYAGYAARHGAGRAPKTFQRSSSRCVLICSGQRAVGRCQPRWIAASRSPRHSAAPPQAVKVVGQPSTWPTATTVAPASAATA